MYSKGYFRAHIVQTILYNKNCSESRYCTVLLTCTIQYVQYKKVDNIQYIVHKLSCTIYVQKEGIEHTVHIVHLSSSKMYCPKALCSHCSVLRFFPLRTFFVRIFTVPYTYLSTEINMRFEISRYTLSC